MKNSDFNRTPLNISIKFNLPQQGKDEQGCGHLSGHDEEWEVEVESVEDGLVDEVERD